MITRTMTVLDILTIYQIQRYNSDTLEYPELYALWKDMEITFPDDFDSNIFWETLLEYCGELEPRYNDTVSFQRFSQAFFMRNMRALEIRLNAWLAEYDILNNYDVNVDEDIDTVDNTKAHDTTDSIVNNKVAPFNDDSYHNANLTNSDVTADSTVDYTRDKDRTMHEYGIKPPKSRTELVKEAMDFANEDNPYTWLAIKYGADMCVEVY